MTTLVRDRYWERRGYVSGTCMFHDPTRLCYLNIPKNASTFLKENLVKQEWVMLHNSVRRVKRETTNTIIILRDPIDRWFTGIAQHITTNLFGKDFGSSHFLEQQMILPTDSSSIKLHLTTIQSNKVGSLKNLANTLYVLYTFTAISILIRI